MGDFEEIYQENYKKAVIPAVVDNSNDISKKILKMAICTQKIGFTLTFAKMWHDEDPDTLFHYFVKFIADNFEKNDKIIIFPEFTVKGILHFHGIIYNCYQRYINKKLKDWRKTYGIVKMEYAITEKWESYIQKDVTSTGYPVYVNI